jgi:hypothetical protein
MSNTETSHQAGTHDQVDVRGPRFVAWVTTAVLIATLIVGVVNPTAAAVILGLQTLVFAFGAAQGPRQHPYGRIYAKLVAPRLGPVTEREPVPPLKFAQLVGFVFAIVGTAGFECSLRYLPRLPALPPRRASAPRQRLTSPQKANRKDPLHGTLRRPGLH